MFRWVCHAMTVLALLALGYAQMGFFLQHEALRISIQRGIKDRIRRGLPCEKLTAFSMPKQDWDALNWVKPGREFSMGDGALFDVVTVSVIDGIVEAMCVADHEETELFSGLREHVERNLEGNAPDRGPSARVNRLIEALGMPPARTKVMERAWVRICLVDRLEISPHAGFSLRWSPPPDAVGWPGALA